mgnify:CR=1 FL=1
MTELPIVRSFKDAQGIEITFYEWPVANPKASVQIVHGLGEHARRYDHVAEALNKAGYGVYADDHRGHGVTGSNMRAKGLIKQQGNLGPGGMPATFAAVRQLSRSASPMTMSSGPNRKRSRSPRPTRATRQWSGMAVRT